MTETVSSPALVTDVSAVEGDAIRCVTDVNG